MRPSCDVLQIRACNISKKTHGHVTVSLWDPLIFYVVVHILKSAVAKMKCLFGVSPELCLGWFPDTCLLIALYLGFQSL